MTPADAAMGEPEGETETSALADNRASVDQHVAVGRSDEEPKGGAASGGSI